jgi:hypothetical protein
MKKDIQSGEPPMFGQYVKLIATGEIVEWNTYDPKTQMLEIELPQGGISTVPRSAICRITPNEEADFLRSRGGK